METIKINDIIHEVRNNYTDEEDNCTRIDVWTSDDDNAEGFTVAVVCQDTGKVIWFKTEYINSEKVKEAIAEVKPKLTIKDAADRLLSAIYTHYGPDIDWDEIKELEKFFAPEEKEG